jgi:hypothetical protein
MKMCLLIFCLVGLMAGASVMACGSGPKPVHYGTFVCPMSRAKAPVAAAKSAATGKVSAQTVAKGNTKG